VRAGHPADIGAQAAGEVTRVSPQAVGGGPFEVVPDWLGGLELWRLRRELFQRQPGVGLTPRLKGRASGQGTAVPEEDDMAAPMPPERPPEVGHGHGLEVVGLDPAGQAQGLALRRPVLYRRPLGPLPMGTSVLVALDSAALRHLAAPPPATQERPAGCGVRAHPTRDAHHRREAMQGPELVGQAMRPGPRHQQVKPLVAWLVGYLAWPPRHGVGGEGRVAPLRPGPLPPGPRGDRGRHPARHRAHAQALGEESTGTTATSF
jgi:hypothetical protein